MTIKKITTRSKCANYVEVEQELLLDETPTTRLVFKPAMHPDGIRGDIIRIKKDKEGNVEEPVPVDFRALHANEGVKITLRTEAIVVLYQRLQELYRILHEKGIVMGEQSFIISDANSLVIDDNNKATIIKKLLDADLGNEIWEHLSLLNPELASSLAATRIQDIRMTELKTFSEMLEENCTEKEWQKFFEKNTWIFGYGLRYQFLNTIQSQPNYGGSNITGQGGQRGDFLTSTIAETQFTCLVEIKRPTSELLQQNEYRNGAWGISKEFSGAISQIQVNCAQWEINDSRNNHNQERLGGILTIMPKGIIVIGNTNQLDTFDKRNSFERFRRELHNPDIITYDELYERAKYIVEGDNKKVVPDESFIDYDEVPF